MSRKLEKKYGEPMPRSEGLPEFDQPPINEVVLGIQFNQPPTYNLILAAEVYRKFRARYPLIEEQGPLAPVFETFGGVPTGKQFSFELMSRPDHPRFWFLEPTGHELIQFQGNRFLHNWRQHDHEQVPYPRYEKLRARFAGELAELNSVFLSEGAGELTVNQAEVSYYNRIYAELPSEYPRPDHWLKFLNFGEREPESFNGVYREIVRGPDDQPLARLHCEINSAVDSLGRRMILLTLTFRGAPQGDGLSEALDFLDTGSDMLVSTFARITTEEAHAKWQRSQ